MEDFNYNEKLNSFRLDDSEGDLGYTVHITEAIEVCTELEIHYLKRILDSLEKKNKAINELKDLIRSAHEIATREGKDTNWEAFKTQCKNVL